MRDWQLLIFKLGELEALGRSEPLGLAVRFSGCEVSCGGGEVGGEAQAPAAPQPGGWRCFGAVPASGGGPSRRVSSAWEEGGCAAAAPGNPLWGAEGEGLGDKATPQGWGSPGVTRSPGLQGMGWMGSANWESGVTGRGWWLGVKAGIMT